MGEEKNAVNGDNKEEERDAGEERQLSPKISVHVARD